MPGAEGKVPGVYPDKSKASDLMDGTCHCHLFDCGLAYDHWFSESMDHKMS